MDQLLIALRYYASGTFQIVVGDGFGVDKATVCRTVHHVTSDSCTSATVCEISGH